MKYADLHIHSNHSDGIKSPEEIIAYAKKNNIRYISITDHDSISSQYVTKEEHKDINIIPGIELSTEYNDMEVHLLGYFIDIDNSDLNRVVNELNKRRLKRIEEILFNLRKENIYLTLEDLEINNNTTIGRGHIANAIVKKGYYNNYNTAFRSLLVKGKIGYVKGNKLNYKECLDIIKISDGIPVLAHPGQIYRKIEIENIIKEFKCFGLKGVEVYHPCHSKDDISKISNLAKKYKLCITGGSDYHGTPEKKCKTSLGSYGIDKYTLENLFKNKNR